MQKPMQRQIILDTETTGLDPQSGDRIIEIGCIELIDRKATNNLFHEYLNPEKAISIEALEIHGINNAFLADKPRFADIAAMLISYLEGAELIIHNAPFDLGFLNHEITRANQQTGSVLPDIASICKITDSLKLAKSMHPGQRNSLDALCKRYQIDNSEREQHGAQLDAKLLAQVYLKMTGGQISLALDTRQNTYQTNQVNTSKNIRESKPHPPVKLVRASEADLKQHQAWFNSK